MAGAAGPSFLDDLAGFLFGKSGNAVPDSDGEMTADAGEGGEAGAGGSTSRREDQLQGATRDRLLRALPGTDTCPACASERQIGRAHV